MPSRTQTNADSRDTGMNSILPLKSRLAERCRDAFRTKILEGHWMNVLPSEKQLSQEFQVSRPTLRLALHSLHEEGLLLIQKGKPTQIMSGVSVSRTPMSRRREVILLRDAQLKPDATSLLSLTDPLRHELHRLGHGLAILDALPSGSRGMERTLSEIDSHYRPAYYVLYSVPPSVQRWFQRHGVPAIILGSRPDDVQLPAIEIDPEATMHHAVDFLVRHGHRRLAYFTIAERTVGAAVSHDTFERTCASAASGGVTGIVKTCIARPDRVVQSARELLQFGKSPSALITTDLELLVGLYTTASELHLQIPSDISVLTLGQWPIADYLRPLPTCYSYSWEKLARRIARIVDDHLRLGMWPNRFWKLLPDLRAGKSVATISVDHSS